MPRRNNIYIASRLENAAQVRALRDALAPHGVHLTYDWTTHGSVQRAGVARMREVAQQETAGVRHARVLVALLPGGRGTHVEIGIALGLLIPVLLVGEQPGPYDCAFYHHPLVERVAPEAVERRVLELLTVAGE